MRKALTISIISLLIFSTFSMLAPQACADGMGERIRLGGFTSPRNRAPLLGPGGNAPTGSHGSSNLVNSLKDPGNFGPGGIIQSSVEFTLPFVTTIESNSLVDSAGKRVVDVFFAGLSTSPLALSDGEAIELERFLMAGGVLYISGNTGSEGPGYNKLFEVLGVTDRFSTDTVWTGNHVQTSTPISTPATDGPFGIVGPLVHTPFRVILPGSNLTGVATGHASASYIIAEGQIGGGYISVTGDPLYFNFFTEPDADNLHYFLNLVALASRGPRRFDPPVDGFGFFNYGRRPECTEVYTLQQIYERIKHVIPLDVPSYVVLIAAQLLYGWWIHQGHCLGMAETAVYYYYHQNEIPSGYNTIFDIKAGDFFGGSVPEVRTKVEYAQHDQIFTDHDAIFNILLHFILNAAGGVLYPHASFEKELSAIKAMAEQYKPAILGIWGAQWAFPPIVGHAVVAYDFEQDGDAYVIKNYDSNWRELTHEFDFKRDALGRLYIDNDHEPDIDWFDLVCLNAPLTGWTWDFIKDNAKKLIGWIKDNLEILWDELMDIKDEMPDLWNEFVDWVKDNAKDVWNKIIHFKLHSPADLHVYDSDGMHVGLAVTGDLDLGFDALYLLSDRLQYCAMPNPQVGDYIVEIVGTGDGSYGLDIDLLIEGSTVGSQTFSGEIVDDAVYVYAVSITDEVMASSPDPVAELDHLKEFIDGLPDASFDNPKLTNQRKKAVFNKIGEVILKAEAGNYTDAVDKLFHDIRAKMDGDSTAEDWIIDPETQIKPCVIIDHIISSIETLQHE